MAAGTRQKACSVVRESITPDQFSPAVTTVVQLGVGGCGLVGIKAIHGEQGAENPQREFREALQSCGISRRVGVSAPRGERLARAAGPKAGVVWNGGPEFERSGS